MGLAISQKTIDYAKTKKEPTKGFNNHLRNAKEYYSLECAKVAQAYADERAEHTFNEARLTHPMIGFKHRNFEEYYEEVFGRSLKK